MGKTSEIGRGRWFMVDVEAHFDAPCPGLSHGKGMTEFAAVQVGETRDVGFRAFWGRMPHEGPKPSKPTNQWPLDLVVVEGSLGQVMKAFADWLGDNPRFISDNNGYDWQWVNHAFHSTLGSNPFGHSSTNLGSLYKGMRGDMRQSFKHLRIAKHTHNPVDDSIGNVQALLRMIESGLVFPLCIQINRAISEAGAAQ